MVTAAAVLYPALRGAAGARTRRTGRERGRERRRRGGVSVWGKDLRKAAVWARSAGDWFSAFSGGRGHARGASAGGGGGGAECGGAGGSATTWRRRLRGHETFLPPRRNPPPLYGPCAALERPFAATRRLGQWRDGLQRRQPIARGFTAGTSARARGRGALWDAGGLASGQEGRGGVMATNIEQILRSFVVSKFREIQEEQQQQHGG